MKIILLFILLIQVQVHYISGVRCAIGSIGSVAIDKKAFTNELRRTMSVSVPGRNPKTKQRKLFNPLRHRNWKLVFDEDCGMSSANRIIGGIDADLGQYPWIARIGYTPKTNGNVEPVFQCGGTLISTNYVVTAAHCVANIPNNLKVSTIRLGEYQTNTTIDCVNNVCADETIDVKPQNIFIHQNYSDPQNGYDIALIRLLTSVNITEWVSPICLPYGHVARKKFTNETAETAGWGIYELGFNEGSTILQTVQLPILNFTLCRKSYKDLNLSESDQLCVGGEVGKDSCNGDSGGPLMKVLAVNGIPRYYLLGVVSFGSKYCGMAAMPAIYTKLSSYLEWLLDNVKMYK